MNKAKLTGVVLILAIMSGAIWVYFSPEIAKFHIPLPIAIPTIFLVAFLTLWVISLIATGSFTALVKAIAE